MTSPTLVDLARDAQQHTTRLGELSSRVAVLCENAENDPQAALTGFKEVCAAYDDTMRAIARMEEFAANNPLSIKHRVLMFAVRMAVKPLREIPNQLQALLESVEMPA